MNIPNFIHERFVDDNGFLTPAWTLVIEQLITQLQQNAGQEGLVPSSLTTAEIATLTNAQNGTLVYNSTTNKLMVNINGTFTDVTT